MYAAAICDALRLHAHYGSFNIYEGSVRRLCVRALPEWRTKGAKRAQRKGCCLDIQSPQVQPLRPSHRVQADRG